MMLSVHFVISILASGRVAKKLGRKAIGYELSEEYCELALDRNRQQVLGV